MSTNTYTESCSFLPIAVIRQRVIADQFQQQCEWCRANIHDGKWLAVPTGWAGWDKIYQHDVAKEYTWCFSCVEDAVLFKLTWI